MTVLILACWTLCLSAHRTHGIKGTGTGTGYTWEIQRKDGTMLVIGSSFTTLGKSDSQMRDQLVTDINGALPGMMAGPGANGAAIPMGWVPFYMHYPGTHRLIVEGCKVVTSGPCNFNPISMDFGGGEGPGGGGGGGPTPTGVPPPPPPQRGALLPGIMLCVVAAHFLRNGRGVSTGGPGAGSQA